MGGGEGLRTFLGIKYRISDASRIRGKDLSSALATDDTHSEGRPGTTRSHTEGLDINLSHFRVLQEFNLGYILHVTGFQGKRTEQLACVHLGSRVQEHQSMVCIGPDVLAMPSGI